MGLAASVLLGAAAASAAPLVYGESAMVKVHPNTPPHAAQAVDVSGARNEFVSFQVVVNGNDTGASNVRASFPGVTGPGGTLGGEDLTLYREAYLNITQTSTPDVATGQWPDGLIPDVDEIAHEKRSAFPFNVPAHESRTVWIDVHVPAGEAVGDYQGQVAITADSGFSATVPVTLHVLPATLPSTSSLASAFLIFSGNVCRAHTGSDCLSTTVRDDLLAKYQRMALDHRFTLTNIDYPGSDWSAFDAKYGPFLDGHADTRLQGAKATSVQYYTWPRDVSHYKAWADHLREKGWLDRGFDYTGDEPPYGISYADIATRAKVVREGAPDLRTLVTTTLAAADQNGVTDDIDTLVPVVNFIDGVTAPFLGDQRSLYDGWLQNPTKRLWLYQSCMSHGCGYGSNAAGNVNGAGWPSYMVDASSARNRAMQWTAYLEGATGELYYETANMLPTAWTNQYSFNGNGDGTLFYPGTPGKIGGKTDVPVPSMRLKYLRMGMQDYEWLKLVSDAGDPDFAQTVARGLIPKASAVSDEGSAFETARRQLEQRYVELTQAVVVPPTNPPTYPPTTQTPPGDGGTPQEPLTSSPSLPNGPEKPLLAFGGCSSSGATGAAPLFGVLLALVFEGRRRKKKAR